MQVEERPPAPEGKPVLSPQEQEAANQLMASYAHQVQTLSTASADQLLHTTAAASVQAAMAAMATATGNGSEDGGGLPGQHGGQEDSYSQPPLPLSMQDGSIAALASPQVVSSKGGSPGSVATTVPASGTPRTAERFALSPSRGRRSQDEARHGGTSRSPMRGRAAEDMDHSAQARARSKHRNGTEEDEEEEDDSETEAEESKIRKETEEQTLLGAQAEPGTTKAQPMIHAPLPAPPATQQPLSAWAKPNAAPTPAPGSTVGGQ